MQQIDFWLWFVALVEDEHTIIWYKLYLIKENTKRYWP